MDLLFSELDTLREEVGHHSKKNSYRKFKGAIMRAIPDSFEVYGALFLRVNSIDDEELYHDSERTEV